MVLLWFKLQFREIEMCLQCQPWRVYGGDDDEQGDAK